jgi:N-acetyl-gamma-glutamyl-phosphate reductase
MAIFMRVQGTFTTIQQDIHISEDFLLIIQKNVLTASSRAPTIKSLMNLHEIMSIWKRDEYLMINAGIVGAAGFAGIEVARVLLGHPDMQLVYAASDSMADTPLGEAYPSLAPFTDLTFSKLDVDEIVESCDVVFLAVPHTASLAVTPQLVKAGLLVVDLSADYRLHDAATYELWYDVEHTSPELLPKAVYGLPELHRDELKALRGEDVRLVASPGCYPTASALAAIPALKAGLWRGDAVISDCLSGVSGAGRKLVRSSMFCSAGESASAYGVARHRHTPEIAQTLSEVAGSSVPVIFTPHLIPVKRGILATVYIPVKPGCDVSTIQQAYEEAYQDETFVTVLPAGTMPQLSSVTGSNECQMGLALDGRTNMLIVSSAIDNLCKGAASQAVQAANVVLGLDEDAGLTRMLPAAV